MSCSIEDCDHPVQALGLCFKHYQRQRRYGVVTLSQTPTEEKRVWLERHLSVTTADCIQWPFDRDAGGYGNMYLHGKSNRAHVVMCTMVHGERPPGMQAAHECGKGHEGCVNPKHLQWKTPKANCGDRARHGTQQRKLTPAWVVEIKAALQNRYYGQQKELAQKYGVTPAVIAAIRQGKVWASVTT